MNYGYFDEKNKEYVITKPNTPSAWANYLGSPEYGAIISNNAGGYSFVKSGANGRVIRYRFNSVTTDQPGRYVYLRDCQSGDYWSASWMPIGKPLDEYQSECRHGTGYTFINSAYKGIATESLYYVPKDKTYEVWRVRVTNQGQEERKLAVTGYVEFTNEANYEQDQVNLQYTLFISRTYFQGKFIKQVYNENFGDPNKERFFGLAGAKVDAYCGDRDAFVGTYRGYHNPAGIENGLAGNLNYCGNSCGALESEISLKPGETKEFIYLLGAKPESEAATIIARYETDGVCETELLELKEFWHGKLGNLEVNTPDNNFNNMVNVWNSYQCFITFTWSRAASFQYCGQRNGFGYRDTVQDIQGIIHLDPEMAAGMIRFMLSAQVNNGAGLPLVKYHHNPGHEDTPDDASYVKETGHPSYRADDALWLFPTIYKYISETGNAAFLDEVISYANNGEAGTVYDHLQRAIDFSMNNLGAHGMPAGLHADWNDCLRLGKKGESTFVAFQLYYAVKILRVYAQERGDGEYVSYLDGIFAKLEKIMNETCWNGDRWIRGFKEDGVIIGQKGDAEASMWLNPQSWGIISGFSTREQAVTSMDSVYRELSTPYGIMVMYPAYQNHAFDGALMVCFNNGVKENAGIFSQPQGWAILAESLLGRGNRAFEYWKNSSPAYMNDDADKRVLEPYVHGQFTEGRQSPFAGRSHVHWLTGTASTVMVGTVEGILGLRPELKGLVINPSIPTEWKEFSMKKSFRGKKLTILVNNPDGVESGVKKMTVNGVEVEGVLVPEAIMKDENDIVVTLG
ncbi:MAG: N,N'-diacetylchitobiose phosphorylase [Lachnospiraceae bacterium]|jgi:cellobiose phosphorylase|nr:N,N'-diacetylchitobiose phosphorylase [Lachnospiraceae bacterium]